MAGIIKAGSIEKLYHGESAVEFNLHDFSNRADEYLRQVQQQADQVLQQANRQAEQIRQQAELEGRQAAMRSTEELVRQEVSEQLATLLPAMERAIDSVQQTRHEWLEYWESNVLHLATAIAARVIRREVTNQPEITLDLLRESLNLAAGGTTLTVRLHPDDYDALGTGLDQLASHFNGLSPTDIVADAEIEPGGCKVHTEFGCIDQQISTQLQRIQEELGG